MDDIIKGRIGRIGAASVLATDEGDIVICSIFKFRIDGKIVPGIRIGLVIIIALW